MSGALRFSSTAAMPERLRQMVERQGRATPREQADAPPLPKPNKYRNTPTTVDGIRFDSRREARYYEQLKLRQAAGEVSYWLRQVPLHLPGGARYVVDFLVFFSDAERPPEYVDVKGVKTDVFLLKKRMVEHHYPIAVRCV